MAAALIRQSPLLLVVAVAMGVAPSSVRGEPETPPKKFQDLTVGYVLFYDGKPVGHEPTWSRAKAIANLRWNQERYPEKKVEGHYNGEKLVLPPRTPSPPLTCDRVYVKPVFLVPTDAEPPPKEHAEILMRHLRWAQTRYRELLFDRDTFTLAEGEPLILRGKHDAAHYRAKKDQGAEDAVLECFAHDKVDRFSCPYVYVVLFVGTGRWPAGGGRPINGGINTGGGIFVTSAESLVEAPNIQSTIQHELGHAFGLLHVNAYGYDMRTNDSVMSYNRKHHTRGFEPSDTPGILIPDDIRALALNHRVFPKLHYSQDDWPEGYEMHPKIPMLGPMALTGQREYTGPRQPDFHPKEQTADAKSATDK